jgi:hypothetical protein
MNLKFELFISFNNVSYLHDTTGEPTYLVALSGNTMAFVRPRNQVSPYVNPFSLPLLSLMHLFFDNRPDLIIDYYY